MSGFNDLLMQSLQQNIDDGHYAQTSASLASNNLQNQTINKNSQIVNSLANNPPAAVPQQPQDSSPSPYASVGTSLTQGASNGAAANAASGAAGGAASSGAAAGLGGDLTMSDKNLKKNIKNVAEKDIDEFINSLVAKSFDYKDEQDGTHTEAGVMAQDLQKSKLGANTVVETPRGLGVDVKKLAPMLAAIMSQKVQMMDEKLEEALKNKFKGKK